MPAEYHIDTPRRLVITRGIGILTFGDLEQLRERLVADPAFDATFRQLFDLTRTTEIAFSTPEVQTLASRSLFQKGVLRAFVATDTQPYGLLRMFQAYRESNGQVVGVFRDLETAAAWLDGQAIDRT